MKRNNRNKNEIPYKMRNQKQRKVKELYTACKDTKIRENWQILQPLGASKAAKCHPGDQQTN